jgi:hypothetical protein
LPAVNIARQERRGENRAAIDAVRDLAPIVHLTNTPLMLCVHPNIPAAGLAGCAMTGVATQHSTAQLRPSAAA